MTFRDFSVAEKAAGYILTRNDWICGFGEDLINSVDGGDSVVFRWMVAWQ